MKSTAVAIFLLLSLYLILGVNGCWRRRNTHVVEEKTSDAKGTKSNEASTRPNISTKELKMLSEELLRLDKNNVGHLVQLNLQGITTSSATKDAAPSPLFATLPRKALQGSTTAAFNRLLDNYIEPVTSNDLPSPTEMKEQADFLDGIMETPVMKKTEEFLKKHKIISGSLLTNLQEIWFTPYSRSKGKIGSSGFEHVFVGEIKNGIVSGLHNWMFFHKEEKETDINYKGYIKILDFGRKGEIIKLRFDWMNKRKLVGSMFVGTSPELEMALYTICFYTRLNKGCHLSMNQKKFRIKVYGIKRGNKNLIGTAFPEIY